MILVCFALKEEAAPFRKIVAGKSDVSILIVGIGRENAGKSIREFLGGGTGGRLNRAETNGAGHARLARTLAPPALVLTCGFAGGLDPDLKVGDVVFDIPAKNQLEPPHIVSYKQLTDAGAKPARFFCADRIATTVTEKKKLRAETGADVVEMESAAIQAVCAEHGIPCITVRVISDMAEEDLPLDFNKLSKPDKNLDFGKLAWAIIRSPGKTGALMELQKKTSFAARQLAAVLEKIIN